jgi:hypothetical protein
LEASSAPRRKMPADELVADLHIPRCTQPGKLAEIVAVGCMNALRSELREERDGGVGCCRACSSPLRKMLTTDALDALPMRERDRVGKFEVAIVDAHENCGN